VYVCVCAGHTWNIPDSVMSLTLIAAGSSVPDAIASLIVVRDGMMPTLLLGHRVKWVSKSIDDWSKQGSKWSVCLSLHIAQKSKVSHTHTRLTALCPGLPGWAGTRKVKPVWILLKQETVSGSGSSWAICKSAPRTSQITRSAASTQVFTGRMPFLPPNQQR